MFCPLLLVAFATASAATTTTTATATGSIIATNSVTAAVFVIPVVALLFDFCAQVSQPGIHCSRLRMCLLGILYDI